MSATWTCVGSVRGDCGIAHRVYGAAVACRERDSAGCVSQGGYSDRRVVGSEPICAACGAETGGDEPLCDPCELAIQDGGEA